MKMTKIKDVGATFMVVFIRWNRLKSRSGTTRGSNRKNGTGIGTSDIQKSHSLEILF